MVRADSPAALLAVVPHLLGFMPEASVVVIGLTPPRDRVRVTLRYELSDPPEADLVADIAALAAGIISSQQLPAAIAVGYGCSPALSVSVVASLLVSVCATGPAYLVSKARHDGRYSVRPAAW